MKNSLLLFCSACLLGATSSAAAAVPCYTVDATKSSLQFVGEQMGAKFDGSFRKFAAKISFSAQDLAASRFDVTVDPVSVDTQEEQRDTALKGPDFFDVAHFKTAHFVTNSMRKTGDSRFEATGKL